LNKGRVLQVYFNQRTGTTAFALVEAAKRIWGVDFDNLRGWHLHPLEDPESHQDIDPINPEEVVVLLADVWGHL